ncbi:MAG: hypothetical protein ACKVKR_16535 [Pseudomonadales bacterium]
MMHIEIVYADLDDQQHIDLQVEEGADVAKCLDLLRLHSQGEGFLRVLLWVFSVKYAALSECSRRVIA